LGNPLFPHPSSLNPHTSLVEDEEQNNRLTAVVLGSAVGGGLVLIVRDKGKGRRGNKFISLFWEIPSSLIPLP